MKRIRNIIMVTCLVLQVMVAVVFGFAQTEFPNTVYFVCWCLLGGITLLSSERRKTI